ncbi:hypothetical protein H5089_13960 [Pseudoalteromonas sp. SR45-1]|uniref:hypothetical protein n=1 Tax=Pseudoalteromonas sp. SR45-1 TaxID=2760932 RepID=UPI001601B7AF|nr:hypothetical protein [Pseudoalteromonas sp. SR45-1]MBB1326599.1 hypothetical protein [Pseudoalteromonas sp. SR45-1]
MEVKTEPAGRLFDILQEARSKPEQHKVRKVWAEVFGLQENDTGTILRMIADLIQLIYKTKSQIEALDDVDHLLYLKPFQKIERMFSNINLEAPWQGCKNQIDEPTIYGLQFCSDKLNRSTKITALKDMELEQIKKSLTELSDMITGSSLEPSLQLLLLRNIESLRQALIAYKIKGIDGIETELELNLGSLVLNKEKIKASVEKDNSSGVFKKYLKLLEGLNRTVSTAKKVDQLTGNTLSKLLGVNDS